MKSAKTIRRRKAEHIKICLSEDVSHRINYWDFVYLIHNALPEINKDEIKTEVKIFQKKLKYPIIIAAIGGGGRYNKKLNETCARIAEELQIGFCVGSQRLALVDKELVKSYEVVKEYDIPLVFANIGSTQLTKQKGKEELNIEDIKTIMDMINADVLTVFLNPAQELIQPEGDENFAGILEKIKELSTIFQVNVKEIGCGISKEVASLLKNANIKGIEVAGVSGTSWTAVEYYRAKRYKIKEKKIKLGKLLWDWGIPAPISILECVSSSQEGVHIIGSGGIRNGLDVAKSIALGGDAASMARVLLQPALSGTKALKEKIESVIEELEATMLLVGAKNINQLQRVPYILTGVLKEWKEQRLSNFT